MIPKVIHYCWFGHNQLPELAKKCIASWERYLPDYEIKEWNEDNFDVNIIPYTEEAYKARKYAFVSDYARFWILFHYGGLYFDTDVEVIKPMDDIINRGPFMGCENESIKGVVSLRVAPGLGLGAYPNMTLYKELLDLYSGLSFLLPNGMNNQTTVVDYTTHLLFGHGLKNLDETQQVEGIFIYPKEYFCPKNYINGEINTTDNSYSIHHYMATWKSPWEKLLLKLWLPMTIKYPALIGQLKRIRYNAHSFVRILRGGYPRTQIDENLTVNMIDPPAINSSKSQEIQENLEKMQQFSNSLNVKNSEDEFSDGLGGVIYDSCKVFIFCGNLKDGRIAA